MKVTMDDGQLKKGYKQTEIGVIPEKWDCPELSEIADIIDGDRGVNYPCQTDFSHDGSCLFLNAGNVTKEGFKFFECAFINKEKDLSLSKGKLKRGDIVLTTRGTVGNFAFFDETVEFEQIRINSGMVILRIAKENLNNKYMYMLLRSRIVGTQIDRVVFGSAQPQLTVKVIKKFSIPIPSSQEQRAIATTLSDVDALIAALDKLIAKKRAIKTATMQQLLTGKKRLPGFTAEWEIKTLGSIGSFKKGCNLPKKEIEQNGVPCVLYGEIYTKYNFVTSSLYSFVPEYIAAQSTWISKGDILFAGSGETFEDIGKCFAYLGEERACAGGDVIIFTPHEADGRFLGYLLNSPEVNKQKSNLGQGSSVIHIYRSSLETLTLQMPSLPEQRAIATVLSDMDAEITALEFRRNKTQAIKQGMMQELLTGRTRLI